MLGLTFYERRVLWGLAGLLLVGGTLKAFVAPPRAPALSSPREVTSAKINVNTATITQLKTLPGVNAELAQRIIAYRTDNLHFYSAADLEHVKGVGPKAAAKLKPFIKFEE